jgi:hypothetical protein
VNRRFILLALASLASCAGNPQRLPVGLTVCNAVEQRSGFAVHATVENKAAKPITGLTLSLAFYRNFRYSQFNASTHLKKELDPGEKRDITLDVNSPSMKESGQAMRCLVTHVGFMDGTSADLTPSQ